jgi:hypothetical protein
MLRKLAFVFFPLVAGATTLPQAGDAETKQAVEANHTQRVNFAPGGVIRVDGSYGDITLEGWDQPAVEISVTKFRGYREPKEREQAMKNFERVEIKTELRSDKELEIATLAPKRRWFLPSVPSTDRAGVSLEYHIRAPRDSKLEIHHGTGSVLINDMTGDIEATGHRGDILLMLRDSGSYAIDAKSKAGAVTSDFAGVPHLRPYRLGERYRTANSPDARRVYLRMGFGGITILAVPPEAHTR